VGHVRRSRSQVTGGQGQVQGHRRKMFFADGERAKLGKSDPATWRKSRPETK